MTYQADNSFQEALLFFQKGETERAEDLCHEVLKSFPEHGNSLNLMGVICLKQGAHQKACHFIQLAMQYYPEKAPIFSHNLALAHTLLGNIPSAIDVYKKAAVMFLERDEKEEVISCLEKAAELLRSQGNLSEAKKFYLSILELDAENLFAYNDLGVINQLENNLDEAVECFQQAIQIDSTYATSYSNLALIFLMQKKLTEAKSALEKCLEKDPESLEAHINFSIVYLEEENFEQSMHHLKRALEIDPEDPGVYNNMGILFHRQGNLDEAILHYKKALELDPSYENAQKHLNLALERSSIDSFESP